jgi:hypothetical protein
MALKTITGKLTNPGNINVPDGTVVTAQISAQAVVAATQEIVPSIVTATTVAGAWSMNLEANGDLTPGSTFYTFTAQGGSWTATAVVPQTAGPFTIEAIMAVPPNVWLGGTAATVNPAGDIAARSFTASSTSPYSAVLPGNAAVATPSGVSTGKIWDWGGEVYNVMAAGAKGDGKTFVAGAMNNAQSTLTDTTNAPFAVTDITKKIDIYPTVLTTPLPDAFDYLTTGGSLAAGTYWYRISATNAFGETLASAEVSVVIPTGTATNQSIVGWLGVTGATGYNVYGRTVNAELKIATLGNVTTYTDSGSISPSGVLPASNTTANSSMTLSALTITGFTSASVVTVSSPATATVAGQSYSFGTDDTVALNSVVGSNRRVLVPPTLSPGGFYWLSNTWSWNGVNNWILEGCGKGASIIRRGNAVAHRMLDVIGGSSKFVIRDLGLDQNGVTNAAGATCHGVYSDFNSNDGLIEGNAAYNSPGFAFFVFGGPGTWSYNLRVWNNDVLCLDGATIDVINVISKGGSTCFNRITAAAQLAINIYESRDHPCIGNSVQLQGQTGVAIRVSSSLGCPVTSNTIVGSANDYGIQFVKESDNAHATPQTDGVAGLNTLRGSGTFIAFGFINASGVSIWNNLSDISFVGVNYISGTNNDITVEHNRFLGNTNSIFSGTPPVTASYKDNEGYNPQGTAAITVTASPFTYTAGPTPEVVYLVGGTVTFIVKNGITLGTGTSATVPVAIPLQPNEAVVITYSVAPTMNKDRK